jgi:hypothetical protein
VIISIRLSQVIVVALREIRWAAIYHADDVQKRILLRGTARENVVDTLTDEMGNRDVSFGGQMAQRLELVRTKIDLDRFVPECRHATSPIAT